MLKNSFCSSPWIHVRLRYDGTYSLCRWGKNSATHYNIANSSISEFYNSEEMKNLRTQLLNGQSPSLCSLCYYQDQHGKVNGRHKQLLKSAINLNDFDLSMRSSPHYEMFKHSYENQGHSTYHPVDLQIDLGNACNSACIMCEPESSSRLQLDYKKLHNVEPNLFESPKKFSSWTKDVNLINKFVSELEQLPNLGYIHFIGGETLYDPAFYAICERLVELDIAKNIIVGTTTNGTIFDHRIEKLIPEFKEFHLGISIEAVTPINDYVRWPSQIDNVLKNISDFQKLEKNSNLFNSLRITPNLFTIYEFDQFAEYMIENKITAESCNILYKPAVLKMEVMPEDIRIETIEKLNKVINRYNLSKNNIVNIRNKHSVDATLSNTIVEYRDFIFSYTVPENVEQLRYNLVKFLKAFETLRGNKITDYAPRFTEFLKHYGY